MPARTRDPLLEDILVDAYGDDEQLWALREASSDGVQFPVDASVVGQPVVVDGVEYEGNERRGLVARCRRDDGRSFRIGLADLRFAKANPADRYLAAYRAWLNLEPVSSDAPELAQPPSHRVGTNEHE